MDKKSKPWYYVLTWKHYAAAGVVVALIISLLLLAAVNTETSTVDEPSSDNVQVPTPAVDQSITESISSSGTFGFLQGIARLPLWFLLLIIPVVFFIVAGKRNIGMVIAMIVPLVIIMPMFFSITNSLTEQSNLTGTATGSILSLLPVFMILGMFVVVASLFVNRL